MTKEERSWVIYDWANSAYTMVVTTALLQLYFKQHVAVGLSDVDSTAYWGYTNTIATLAIAVIAPILGTLADHKNFKKRLFVLFLGIGLVSTVLLATIGEGMWIWCLVIYGVSHLGFYGAVIFYDAFIVDVAKPQRRDWISSAAFGWGYIGGTIPFLLCAALYLQPGIFGLPSEGAGARIGFIITAIWWFGFTIPMLRNVKQIYHVPEDKKYIRESFTRLAKTFREIRKHRQVFIFLAAFFLYIDGVHTIIKMAFSFGQDLGLDNNTLVIGLLVVQFVGFPFALIYGALAKRFGSKYLLLVGVFTYAVVTIIAYNLQTAWHFYLLTVLVGTAQGGVQSLSRSLYSRIIPNENAAQFFGFYDIFGKFAAVLGPTLVGASAQITGETRTGVLSLIVLFAAGGFILLFVRQPKDDDATEPAP